MQTRRRLIERWKAEATIKMKLITSQRKLLANYYATLAVAWFTAGVITPFISSIETTIGPFFIVSFSLFASYLFLGLALFIMKTER